MSLFGCTVGRKGNNKLKLQHRLFSLSEEELSAPNIVKHSNCYKKAVENPVLEGFCRKK